MNSSKKLSAPKRRFFISLFAVVILLGIGAYVFLVKPFSIRRVICEVGLQPCPDYIQAELEKNLGKSLFFTRYDQIIRGLIAKQPSLLSDGYSKKLSGTVKFSFHEIGPDFAIELGDHRVLLFNSRGFITEEVGSTELPRVIIELPESQAWVVGTQLPLDFAQNVQEFISAVQLQKIPVRESRLKNAEYFEVTLNNGKIAIIPRASVATAINTLNFLLLHQEELDKKEPYQTLDLRFRYPILKP